MADHTQDSSGGGSNPFSQLFGAFNAFAGGNAAKSWETWFGGQLDRFVRSEQFLGQMGKALEGSMLFKAQMDRLLEQSLRSMRMPALSDLEAVHQRLDEMERRLEAMAERLDAVAPPPVARKAPARTPKPAASKPKAAAPKAAEPKVAAPKAAPRSPRKPKAAAPEA